MWAWMTQHGKIDIFPRWVIPVSYTHLDSGSIVHHIYDVIDKGWIIVLDKAGVLPGCDDLKVFLPFDFCNNSGSKAVID